MLQHEYDFALRATKSTLFESLRVEHQERLRGQLAEIARQHDDARATYQKLRLMLLDTPSWPTAPPPPVHGNHKLHIELLKCASEFHKMVTMMNGILPGESMRYNYKQPPNPFSDGDSDGINIDSSISGAGAGAPRSRMHQRVDKADDTEQTYLTQHDPNMPSQQELNKCREQLIAFEDQVKSLHNEIAQYELDNAAKMAHIVASKAKEAACLKEPRVRDRERRERNAAMHAKTQRETVASCESNITEMVVDIADMMSDVSKLQIKLDEETWKWDESYQKLRQVCFTGETLSTKWKLPNHSCFPA